jgi:hypothetical protein
MNVFEHLLNSLKHIEVIRQESTLSLQVPLPGMGQRKVTFSQVQITKHTTLLTNITQLQVVDQLACSLSDSSSLSDISCGEDFKLSVSGSNMTRRSRKLYKPNRLGERIFKG